MAQHESWGWYQPSAWPGWNPFNSSNIDGRLNGTQLDTSYYTTMTLHDLDGDGIISDGDSGDGSLLNPGELVVGPSLTLYPQEIGLYTGGTMVADGVTYTGLNIQITLFTDGTWGARLMDTSIPDNVFPHEITSVTLGTWNGVEYSGIFVAGVDDPLCFAADVSIATPRGLRPAGTLRRGDRVLTQDHGSQVLIWVGQMVAGGRGKGRVPVLIPPGVLGARSPVRLSRQHGVLIRSPRAELLFGSAEVLVPAGALTVIPGVRETPAGRVRWVHLMTARHDILSANGLLCEGFRPGPWGQSQLPASMRAEVSRVSRGADTRAARPILRLREARLLLAEGRPLAASARLARPPQVGAPHPFGASLP